MTNTEANDTSQRQGLGCLAVTAIIIVTIAVTVGITFWVVTHYIFPRQFEPVYLNSDEQQILDQKLNSLQEVSNINDSSNVIPPITTPLNAEKYSEIAADRTILLSERELNSLLNSNTDLAHNFAIDLSNNLASGKLLINLSPDFPIMGGKTIKLTAGLKLSFLDDRPVVILTGVSVMGVPIPNAWLGDMKNVDLVKEFNQDTGFWKTFAAGVQSMQVTDDQLLIVLKP